MYFSRPSAVSKFQRQWSVHIAKKLIQLSKTIIQNTFASGTGADIFALPLHFATALLKSISVAISVPSKIISHWPNICSSAHAFAQRCRHTTSEVFQAVKGICDMYTLLNFGWCKFAKTTFHCANCLAVYCAFAHLRGNTGRKGMEVVIEIAACSTFELSSAQMKFFARLSNHRIRLLCWGYYFVECKAFTEWLFFKF